MFSKLPIYQEKGKSAYRPDLFRMEQFCSHLNNPEKKVKSIHIAGTNGKGSTAHIMASVLQESGYKIGLYTSPHLKDFRERIKINGILIKKEYIIKFIDSNYSYIENNSLSFFEMSVGLAFNYFFDQKVDFNIIEVGMGGRLDGTNLINPELSIITNIGLDHTQFLGNTLVKIAEEKAGIIKPRTPIIIGETQRNIKQVFELRAKKLSSPLIFADKQKSVKFESDLIGSYQKKNIQTAIIALKQLKIVRPKKIKVGLKKVISNTGILGRWQILGKSPLIVADTAHNKEAFDHIIPQIKAQKFKELHLVLGFVKEKEVKKLLSYFPNNAKFYLSSPKIPRAFSNRKLKKIADQINLNYNMFTSVKNAFIEAKKKSNSNDFIFVGGSTFVVAEII